jgi:hypothetical protein
MVRTKHLDKHMAHLCQLRADNMADNNRRNGWEDLCGDIANIRGLSPLLRRHASDEEIRKYISNMDTACREQIPNSVWEAFR